jgi:hypothetical protein
MKKTHMPRRARERLDSGRGLFSNRDEIEFSPFPGKIQSEEMS